MPDNEEKKNENENENPIIRNAKRVMRLLGVTFQEDVPKLKSIGQIELNTYTQTEMRHLPGFDLPEEQRSQANNSLGPLEEYIRSISNEQQEWAEQIKAIKVLTPEIDRSAEIMVSSIMSPTDIQTDSVNIICTETDLGQNIEEKISKILTNFYNDIVDLGNRVYKYTKQALYEEGSACILILPQSNVGILNRAADVDMFRSGRGPILRQNYKELEEADNKTNTKTVIPSFEFLYEQSKDPKEGDVYNWRKSLDTRIAYSIEEFVQITKPAASTESHAYISGDEKRDAILKGSTSEREAVLKVFNDSTKGVVITRDVTAVNQNENRLRERIEKMADEVSKNFMFDKTNPTFLISDLYDENDKQNPAIVEIPPRAVVPITIPGSPEKHIGYFILLDQWGAPMMGVGQVSDNAQYGSRRLSEASASAAFGTPMTYRFNSSIDDKQRYDITSTIFGLTLKQLIDNRLNDYGLLGATVELNDAITTCIFRQVLAQKQCKMVFVPEPMMVYMRFDHRDNGTGKPITENLATLLALRTVLLMSYIMAATENSVNNKVITVDVDEKQSNVMQLVEMIRNAYSAKKMMRFNINPITVQQDLIQKSLTIIPKGIKGLPNSLEMQTEHRQTGAIAPDEGLLEKINEWIVTALQVPHSALNQLSENEYSRSVATTNLYFSNNVKSKQKVVIKYMTKFVRLYARFSHSVRNAIASVISESDNTAKDVKSQEAADNKSSIKVDTNKEDSVNKRINMIIGHLKIDLPTPRIVVDKSQYAEIEQYIATIEKIVEVLYPDDIATGDAQPSQEAIKALRAAVKIKMVREYINQIGFQSIYDLPAPQDIPDEDIRELIQRAGNIKISIANWTKHVITPVENAAGGEDQMNGGGAGAGGDMYGDMGAGGMGGSGGYTEGAGAMGGEGGAGGEAEGGASTPQESTSQTPAADDFGQVQTPPKL